MTKIFSATENETFSDSFSDLEHSAEASEVAEGAPDYGEGPVRNLLVALPSSAQKHNRLL